MSVADWAKLLGILAWVGMHLHSDYGYEYSEYGVVTNDTE